MNMALTQATISNPDLQRFIGEQLITIVAQMAKTKTDSKLENAYQLLDQYFPLENGSHAQVKSYVIYYQNLMAFMQDGSETGLQTARQFVALSGHKSEPSAILLKSPLGHIEIDFNRCSDTGRSNPAGICNIQVQTSNKTWVSLLHEGQVTNSIDKHGEFTAKDGEDYQL
ncbi:hypothetical protein [Shewanella marina]|uniref:hypothetical protein n=1 Tax=Shewanella marina TaxID=487319 RepID=UPI0004700A8B|nr:hypothetical protein [Shewanella marina]